MDRKDQISPIESPGKEESNSRQRGIESPAFGIYGEYTHNTQDT